MRNAWDRIGIVLFFSTMATHNGRELYGWSVATFDLPPGSDAKRLRTLEDENRRLKTMVADQALDIQGLRYLLGKR